MAQQAVKAVLFDSGGVLMGPIGGRWDPRFDFEEIVLRVAPHLTDDDFTSAIATGDQLLRTATSTPSRDAYHEAMLSVLGVEATAALLADLDRPLPWTSVVEPFADAIEALDHLRERGIRMAVVSDSTPHLPDAHAGIGLGGYFEAYAISEVLGYGKPDPRMYRHASDALQLDPSECLFVDDHPPYVEAAIALGYQGVALRRDGDEATTTVPSITSLSELAQLIR